MADKKCPHCGLWNLETALQCDCGFDFSTGTKPMEDADKKLRVSARMAGIGFGLSLLAGLPYLLLAGFYLSRSTPAHAVISSITSFALLPGFFFGLLLGSAGIVLGILGWARMPRNRRLLVLALICLLLGGSAIAGNAWFYATCQFCQ